MGLLSGAWHALQVRLRSERSVATLLHDRGYSCFLPNYVALADPQAHGMDRRLPMFPGYLFCHYLANVQAPIITTPGVIRIVGSGRIPVPVSETELESIRAVVASEAVPRPCPFMETGDKVVIVKGPLRGVVGVLQRVKSDLRLVVSVSLMRRSVSVELPSDDITRWWREDDFFVHGQRRWGVTETSESVLCSGRTE